MVADAGPRAPGRSRPASLTALLAQLATALRQAPAALPLGQKGDWVVMAAWLLQLRSQLLLPADVAAQQDAAAVADQLRGRLVDLQAMQRWLAWLERRPQLGRDVFPPWPTGGRSAGRSSLRLSSISSNSSGPVWRCLMAGEPAPATMPCIARVTCALSVSEARARILRRLADAPGEVVFEQLLPDPPDLAEAEALAALRRRSAWSSTFAATLELAKQGDVVVAQAGSFQPIHLARV